MKNYKVVLYTTHCPRCEILKKKLNDKNIDFKEVDDVEIMLEKNFASAPMLEVTTIYDYNKATEWVNKEDKFEE